MAKQNPIRSGIIYSTDPGYNYNDQKSINSKVLDPSMQKLKIRLETKNRGGKCVTIVEGWEGTEADKEQVTKNLKTYCGTGGSYKDGLIIIQGDNRDKVLMWLHKNGFEQARKV